MSEDVSAILDDLALRFGSTGAHLWEELVRYEVASAVAYAVLLPLSAAAAWWLGRRCCNLKDKNDAELLGGSFMIVSVGLAVFSLIAIGRLVTTLVAPEAATLKGLLP